MTAALVRGWLVAWSAAGGVPVGATVLLMIHAITGGRWGEALGPVLRPAAALMPLVAILFLPVALALPAAYPWAAEFGAVVPSVARTYLNAPFFLARAAVALVGWSVLGNLAGRGRMGRLTAGLGLAFYGLTISLVAVDWLLSVEPRYTSSAFAAGLAIQQMLSALAVAALVTPPGLDEGAASDLAGLILATLLGVLYIAFMAFIVAWYGDLPVKASWFGRRGQDGWGATIALAALAGGVGPFVALLFGPVRRSPAALRLVAVPILAGILLHLVWLVLPAYSDDHAAALAVMAVVLALMVGGGVWAAGRLGHDQPVEARHAR